MLAMANWDANFGPEKDESYAENFAEPIEFYIGMIKSLEKKILADKQARKVSDKKVEQQVAPSMVYDIIEGLKKNNFHEEAVILEILMKYPYRAEVGTLHFMHLKTYNALKKKKAWPPALSTGLKNYLIVGKRKMIVSRSDYKTFDTYGTIENEIKDKQARKVSDKKVEQQVAPSMVYDIIEGLKKNNFHEEAVILEILMKYPYRAEVGTLHFMHLKTYNALKKKKAWPPALSTGLKNYLIVGKRKMIVSRSDYKTFDTYGTIENEIKDKAVKKSLNEWIDVRKNGEGGWLGEMSPIFTFKDNQDVSKRLGYVTKKIAGISLGPAAIVKIMLSNQKFTDMAEAADFLREASRIRGTALNVLQDVYLHAAKLED